MKLYSSCLNARTEMLIDENLINEITKIKNEISIIIETGTFEGTGSTKYISDIFQDSITLKTFYTIEVNKNYYLIAMENLKKYSFVKCINGFSLDLSECLNFIDNDEYLLNHEKYDNIYIDSFDPIRNYKEEIMHGLNEDQNIFTSLINENYYENLFIILDSAGGVGYFEFLKTMEMLKNKSFYLLLDDVNHIKHYRSKKYIMDNTDFKVLITNDDYLFCKYK